MMRMASVFMLLLAVVASAKGQLFSNIWEKSVSRVKRADDMYVPHSMLDNLAKTVQHQASEITELKALLTRLQTDLGQARTEVGFFAVPSSSRLNVPGSGNIVFATVHNNQGNAYDARSGLFTAPVNGLYAFFLTIRSYSATGTESADITLNGSGRARAYVTAQDAQATAHVTLHLTKGQSVYLKNAASSNYDLAGGIYSQFTGFLVQADP